ncbi:MAG: hypothetical protein ABF633_03050 [Clostridium sp.]|uniref:hypothetical protein n=1 Tax=Clostridium sp. TaxID=1506 RepID=UPI0039EB52F4
MSKDKSIESLEELCKPVVEYLKNNYNPHCTVVITDSQIKLVEDVISIPEEAAPEGQVQEQAPKFISSTSNGICIGGSCKRPD